MTLPSARTRNSQRRIRGRDKRNVTLNIKLTEAEFAAVERYCESRAITFGEWFGALYCESWEKTPGRASAL